MRGIRVYLYLQVENVVKDIKTTNSSEFIKLST